MFLILSYLLLFIYFAIFLLFFLRFISLLTFDLLLLLLCLCTVKYLFIFIDAIWQNPNALSSLSIEIVRPLIIVVEEFIKSDITRIFFGIIFNHFFLIS